jgi:hypothetical protein
VGQHPHVKVLSAAKGAILPYIGDDRLDPTGSPPALYPPPARASPVAAVGHHPFPKALKADKDAIPPDRGDDHLDPTDYPPTLGPFLLASPVTAVGQYPFPPGAQRNKGAIPPDRGGGHREHQRRSRRPQMWAQRSTSNCPKGVFLRAPPKGACVLEIHR